MVLLSIFDSFSSSLTYLNITNFDTANIYDMRQENYERNMQMNKNKEMKANQENKTGDNNNDGNGERAI